jgi:hypothetical protein
MICPNVGSSHFGQASKVHSSNRSIEIGAENRASPMVIAVGII